MSIHRPGVVCHADKEGMEQAYRAGFESAMRGEDRETCPYSEKERHVGEEPYSFSSRMRVAWFMGFAMGLGKRQRDIEDGG